MKKKTNKNIKKHITIPQSELNRIKASFQTQPISNNTTNQNTHHNEIQEWAQNLLKIKQQEEQRQFLKFQKEEELRMLEEYEEDQRQENERKQVIRQANNQYFMEDERVKGLHSAMQYCDVLEERKYQIELKKQIQERKQVLEKMHFEQQNFQLQKYDKNLQQKQQDNKTKKIQNNKFLKNQIVQKQQEELNQKQQFLIEGQKIINDVKLALFEDQIKEENQLKEKQALIKEIKDTNDQMEALKLQMKKQEIQDDKNRDKYNEMQRQKKQKWFDKKKEENQKKENQRQKLIDEQRKLLEELEQKKTDLLLKNIERNEQKKLQEEQLRKKYLDQMKKEMNQQRKFNLQNKEQLKLQDKEENKKFNKYWKQKNIDIEEKENFLNQEKFQIKKDFQNFNKQLAEEKHKQIEQDILQQYIEAEQIKKARFIGEKKFMSYAEQCLSEWNNDGKNVMPILIELQKQRAQFMNEQINF